MEEMCRVSIVVSGVKEEDARIPSTAGVADKDETEEDKPRLGMMRWSTLL